MTGSDLDSYIATHHNLVIRAGWQPDGDAAIESFCNGLIKPLYMQILSHDNLPETMEEWTAAARKEQAKYALKKASGFQGKPKSQKEKWRQVLSGQKSTKDPNAMDVDATRLAPLTEEDRKKLSQEGRCF